MSEHARGDTPIVVSQPVEGATPRSVWALCVLAAVVFVTAAIRLRLLDVPLDRDEGEYAYLDRKSTRLNSSHRL